MAYFGIDLGTSQCLAARVSEGFDEGTFDVRCIPDSEGNESFPSVVSFINSNKYVVGEEAALRLVEHPDSSVELIKVRLGKAKTISLKIDNAEVSRSPQEITSLLLRHLNEARGNKISSPVLTVPAFFDQSQKDATMQSGQLANIQPKQLIEEPTAAIVYQIFSDFNKNGAGDFAENKRKNVLVFDFGGGTLDLSLIHLDYEDGAVKPTVLAVGGDPDLGGNLIDFLFTQVVLEILAYKYPNDEFVKTVVAAFADYFKNYREQHRLAFSTNVPDNAKHFIFKLKRELERVKINLSSKESENIILSRNYAQIPVTRSEFVNFVLQREELNIQEKIRSALEDVSEYCYENDLVVDEVLLIGGSSQIPFIREIIYNTLADMGVSNDAINYSDDYMQAVAKGAAIQSALLSGMAIPPFKSNKCSSVVARDIILEYGNKSTTFVKRGTPYPFADSKTLSIHVPHALATNVTLRLCENIMQQDGTVSKKIICDYPYYLPIYYTGDELRLALNIDSAGLYQVEALHVPTKEKAVIEPQKAFSLSNTELKNAAAWVNYLTECK